MRYLLFLLLLATSGGAFIWPAEQLGFDPFLLSSSGLWMLVTVTMFCLGMVVQPEELLELRQRPFTVLLGVLVQCTWMPALVWLCVWLLQLRGELAQGVLLVGCVPGAMASNVLTMTARGNVSYSVSLTSVATLLSPITVPTALWLLSDVALDAVKIDPWSTSLKLAMHVVLPVALGFGLKEAIKRLQPWANKLAPLAASAALLWIIASVVAANRERLTELTPQLFMGLIAVNLLGYAGGFGVGRVAKMTEPQLRALSLEVGMQNAGLGTAIAVSSFGSESLAQIPTAAYTFGCMFTGTMLAVWWSRRPTVNLGVPLPQK